MPLPSATMAENARFNLGYVLPNVLQGVFLRRPRTVALLSRRGGTLAPGLGQQLRKKYPRGVYVRLVVKPALLVLDAAEAQRVLDESPFAFADSPTKRKGMSLFQPDAVTISRGEEFRVRRRFNERALCPGETHPLLQSFCDVAREESRLTFGGAGRLEWTHLSDLIQRVAGAVIRLPTLSERVDEREPERS